MRAAFKESAEYQGEAGSLVTGSGVGKVGEVEVHSASWGIPLEFARHDLRFGLRARQHVV